MNNLGHSMLYFFKETSGNVTSVENLLILTKARGFA
jgi:hypothetical protein